MKSLRRTAGSARRALVSRLDRSPAVEHGPGLFRIVSEYPLNPEPRYGYGKPAHPELYEMIAKGREEYRALLRSFVDFKGELSRVSLNKESPADPYWHNGSFQGLDAVALYSLLALHNPGTLLEVGSGNSTKFARRAIRDHGLRTTITSIDPEPRAEVDDLCDHTIRGQLETTDLKVFEQLGPGDFLFIDGTHRTFMNSDVTVTFIELLPRLKPGVFVHIHDVFLPWDYPPQIKDWYFSEQYLLASWLLARGPHLEIVLPDFFVCIEPDLHTVLTPIWEHLVWSAAALNGTSFWLRTT